ncbi:hypothetical protein, partial [Escherichia coli]|uniref:hypothetical protein n=1 Tax=Escherichia coli TaxID=562 RepID=UPI00234030C6
ILRGVRQQQDEPGRFSICSRQAAVVQQAGAEFERSAAPIVARLNGIEAHREQERAAQHQKALELERSQRQKGFELGM